MQCIENAELTGFQSEHSFRLTLTTNQNCNQFLDETVEVAINFINLVIPTTQTTVNQLFKPIQNQIFAKFLFEPEIYDKLISTSSANYSITFENQFLDKGTIKHIKHITFDSRHCWDDVEFSVDYDFAFNISVIPLSCEISSQVLVYLEYYNETWIQIPIVPTVVVGGQTFNGFQTGAFDTESVFFYNTSSDVDTTNADLIINFVKYFKINLNVEMRLRVYDNDQILKVSNQFEAKIQRIGNQLSNICHPVPARSNLQSWYSYTTINPNLIVNCLQTIHDGKTLYMRQQTYDTNLEVNQNSNFSVDLQKFRIRLGIPFYFSKTINVDEQQEYYFITMIELRDVKYKMIQAIYYQGVINKSCYYDMITEVYSSKICLKIFTKNNQVCKNQLTTTGIVGSFSGKLDPNISNPALRQTYFWMKMDKVLSNEWFNSYERLCFTDIEDTGQYQGSRVSGSFKSRMHQMHDNIIQKKISYTLAFISDTELYYCTKLVSYIYQDVINYMLVLFVILLIIVLFTVITVFKSNLNQLEVQTN
ncbi:Conserved_hypothetical protein [Hexamita inflata]|uniref:Transmembrane protein n=1 Tax=Hexamita inflata TaxID=28002 RepID=A0AA86UZZ2_9EUKA|nr:Conserved hypothetical protein [Hexamita inflata]